MPNPNKSLIAIDLDGTLLNKIKKVTKTNLTTLTKCINLNFNLVISTGRSITSAKKVANKISNFSGKQVEYISALNGSYIYDVKNQIVHSRLIPQVIVADIIKKALIEKVVVWAYTEDSIERNGVIATSTFLNFFVKISRKIKLIKYSKKIRDLNSYKLNVMSLSKDRVQKVYDYLKAQYSKYIEIAKPNSKLLEITLKNVNKGSAITYIAKKLEIDKTRTISIGDSHNDLPMFINCAYRIALGNADKELVAISNINLPRSGDAVSIALENYVIPSTITPALSIDLDGTLLNKEKQIDKNTIAIITKIVDEHNKLLIINTGRKIEDAIMVIKDFPIKNTKNIFAVCASGGVIYDYHNKICLHKQLIQESVAINLYKTLLEAIEKNGWKNKISIDSYIHRDDQFDEKLPSLHINYDVDYANAYWNRDNSNITKHYWSKREYISESDANRYKFDKIIKFIVICNDMTIMSRVMAILNNFQGQIAITSIINTEIEITSPYASKGTGLTYLSEFLKINIKDILTFGDNNNDISQFEVSNYSYTLSSAKQNVKNKVKYIINDKPSSFVGNALSKLYW